MCICKRSGSISGRCCTHDMSYPATHMSLLMQKYPEGFAAEPQAAVKHLRPQPPLGACSGYHVM